MKKESARGADRREVGRVAEENDPAVADELMKVDLACGVSAQADLTIRNTHPGWSRPGSWARWNLLDLSTPISSKSTKVHLIEETCCDSVISIFRENADWART